jgi:ABC-2 type transport system permease protein
MVIANLKMTVRNRAALFWNLAFPAIFILVFGAIFGNGFESEAIEVGVSGAPGPVHDAFVQTLETNDGFVVHTGDYDEEYAALEDGDRSVVVNFPADGGAISFDYTVQGGPTGEIARVATRSVLNDVLGASTGATITEQEVTSSSVSYIDWFIPGILAMSLMNTGVIGIATAFVSFRERGIFRRIKVTPFPIWKFLLARIVSGVLASLITSGILVGVGALVWGVRPHGNPLVIVIALTMGSLTFVAIGYAVAAIARTTETAASYANLVTFPMMFLSGVFFPVTDMPEWLKPLVTIMPLRYAVDALRAPMLDGEGFGAIGLDLGILATIFAAAMLFSSRFFKWDSTTR